MKYNKFLILPYFIFFVIVCVSLSTLFLQHNHHQVSPIDYLHMGAEYSCLCASIYTYDKRPTFTGLETKPLIITFPCFCHTHNQGQSSETEQEERCPMPYFVIYSFQLGNQKESRRLDS